MAILGNIKKIQEFFLVPMCLYDDFEPLYSLKFFHLSKFENEFHL